jgi:recombinational DNA repair ATPase RecF
MTGSPLLTGVALKNYKSIAACAVELGGLTFLVGPNGAGKSNFLDALRFVADSLRTSLEHALRDRGGINEVRRRIRDLQSPDAGEILARDGSNITSVLARLCRERLHPDRAAR